MENKLFDSNKKVLIITYYWPPMGGGGVHRWLKLTKYLHEYGISPIVFTPLKTETTGLDEFLINEVGSKVKVIKIPITEPYGLYKFLTGKKQSDTLYSGFLNKSDKVSLMQKLSLYIRGNFFIPDAKRLWVKPSLTYLKKYIRENKINTIVSTGPPHSLHLIAMGLKKEFPAINWIADFRDPWTGIDYSKQLKLNFFSKYLHQTLERKVLQTANKVVTVSQSWKIDLDAISGRKNSYVITNGYDSENFSEIKKTQKANAFALVHTGYMNADRNVNSLWQVLSELVNENNDFKNKLHIYLIGAVDYSVFESIERYHLTPFLSHTPYVPHKDAILQIIHADVLLLPINNNENNKGVIPGKLFEYMASGNPILCLNSNGGDAEKIIHETQTGVSLHYDDKNGIKEIITTIFNKEFELNRNELEIKKYDRKLLAKQYAEILY